MSKSSDDGSDEGSVEYDGRRGEQGSLGQWCTLEEATEWVDGKEEWWKTDQLGPIQHAADGPADRPVWMFKNGDMYFGEWKVDTHNGIPVEHGFGITHYFEAGCDGTSKYKGLMYAGEWEDGLSHGQGEQYWLKSSKQWQSNYYSESHIKQRFEGTGRMRGVPFHYNGRWKHGMWADTQAQVTLKDGTTRIGPWEKYGPKGDWSRHHLVGAGAASASADSLPPARQDNARSAKKRKSEPVVLATATSRQKQEGKQPGERKRPAKRSSSLSPGSKARREPQEDRKRGASASHGAKSRESNSVSSNDARRRALQRPRRQVQVPAGHSANYIVVDDSDDDVPQQPVAIKQEEDADPTGSSSSGPSPAPSDKALRVQLIQEYITHQVIGCDPSPATMAKYADNFYDLGFQSVKAIKNRLKKRHIEGFEWMLFLHKEIFLEKFDSAN